jgi:capsule polysaccharide export protein KpsE/RkpR
MNAPQKLPAERSLLETVLHYFSILLRYRWLIIGITGGVTILTVAFAVLSLRLPPEKSPLPNLYRAQAVLLLPQQQGGDLATSIMAALGVEQRAIASAAGFDTGAFVIQVANSRSLLDRIVQEFDLSTRFGIKENVRGRTREALRSRLDFDVIRTTGAITVSLEDRDPVFARDIVNRVVVLLDEWFSQNRGSARIKQRQMLEEKVNEVKEDISRLEDRLKELQKRYGVLNAQELGATQATSLADLRSQLILREIEIKNYSSFSMVDDPRLQQLKEERQNILDLIEQIQQGMPEVASEETGGALKSLPDVAQEFTRLTLELDIQRRIYNTLSPQFEAAKLATETEPIFQVLEMAEAPDVKSGPQRSRIVLTALFASLGGSIVLALLLNAIADARRKAKQGQA